MELYTRISLTIINNYKYYYLWLNSILNIVILHFCQGFLMSYHEKQRDSDN